MRATLEDISAAKSLLAEYMPRFGKMKQWRLRKYRKIATDMYECINVLNQNSDENTSHETLDILTCLRDCYLLINSVFSECKKGRVTIPAQSRAQLTDLQTRTKALLDSTYWRKQG